MHDFGSDPSLWKDGSCHKKPEQRNRFGMLYFHNNGRFDSRRGGVDLVLSNKDDFCLSFLIRRSFVDRGNGSEASKITELEGILHPLMGGRTNMVVLTEKEPDGAKDIQNAKRLNVGKGGFADEPIGAYDSEFCCRSGFRKRPLGRASVDKGSRLRRRSSRR
jgi:hypothetical protein